MLKPKIVILVFLVLFAEVIQDAHADSARIPMGILVNNKSTQIEVGGPFIGVEMHKSSVLPTRIAFYYPLANVIDLGTSYWGRGDFPIMDFGLKIGDGQKVWIGQESFEYTVAPYTVEFVKHDQDKTLRFRYRFAANKPAMILEIDITNNGTSAQFFDFSSQLQTSLKTSHLYELKNQAQMEYEPYTATIYTNYDDVDTGRAQIFVTNAGENPVNFAAKKNQVTDPMVEFQYRKVLNPGQTMSIVQIIGATGPNEARNVVTYLQSHYQEEIQSFEKSILKKALSDSRMKTGDADIDQTTNWAKAILATSEHQFQGIKIPTPCPAEYNLFFTHDILKTDMTAVYFDLPRVKRDLEFIASQAGADGQIPHAIYWSKDHYEKEMARTDNWNHFWFVMVAARYLRHSGDLVTIEKLYPNLLRSVEMMLVNKKDNLIWAYRPDWWDLGTSFGPRSYMTILAIRALHEFSYVSTRLSKPIESYEHYGKTAEELQEQLSAQLWSSSDDYLMNYLDDGSKDPHLYIGSLLAAHFHLIDSEKIKELVDTATNKLFDKNVGIYNAYPMDFENLTEKYKFYSDEVGPKYFYMNGGVWYHGNAWYALALMAAEKNNEAFDFIKKIMTLKGIMSGPGGQPGLYEVRNTDVTRPDIYGKPDKPQFMWAAAWYLHSIYQLLGLRENDWNIGFEPYLAPTMKKASFQITYRGGLVNVLIKGSGQYLRSIEFDGKRVSTAVIPDETSTVKNIKLILGIPKQPYVASTQSRLLSVEYRRSEHQLVTKFLDQQRFKSNQTKIISRQRVKAVTVNGKSLEAQKSWIQTKNNQVYELDLNFTPALQGDTVVIDYLD